jgi:pyruvate dehydrogenase kinase 2/3/4
MSPSDLPPVEIVVADGRRNEDVTVRVSDVGGGIPRSVMPALWSYFYTTATFDYGDDQQELAAAFDQKKSPLAGRGYGLPLSRQYARYFGGDLQLMSTEGYGTDAYFHFCRRGTTVENYGFCVVEL